MRLEIGAGEHPDDDYDVHTDVLHLPGIDVVCRLDRLPFRDATVSALRASDVLEHQSWELIEPTLREWARLLEPDAGVYLRVPDARLIATRWLGGKIDTLEANYWMLGGHSERAAHKGVDEQGLPRWIWNAHHTLFDAGWLEQLLERCGFVQVEIRGDGGTNIECWCTFAGGDA